MKKKEKEHYSKRKYAYISLKVTLNEYRKE